MKNWLRIIFTIILVLVVDLTTKHFLFHIEYYNLIPGVISVATNYGNNGAAFGLFSGHTFALALVSIVMIIALFIFNYFIKRKTWWYCISFGFVMGGALGNLYDRLVYNEVRDFIFLDFWPSFPTFNLADSFLCVGAVMLAIYILFMAEKKDEK